MSYVEDLKTVMGRPDNAQDKALKMMYNNGLDISIKIVEHYKKYNDDKHILRILSAISKQIQEAKQEIK